MTRFYLSLCCFLALFTLSGQIIITEISYNPPESGNDSLEYIELYNAGSQDYNMDQASFSAGITHTFGAVIIPAESYYVIALNANAIQNVFGLTVDQWESGALRNGGELIQLIDANGNELDAVEYGRDAPWPTSTDGTSGEGASIVLCDVTSDNSDGSNWTAAQNNTGIIINGKIIKGSPRADNAISCTIVPDHTIEALPDNTFSPADITINPGEIVRWVNNGGFHNVNGDQTTYPDNPVSFGNGAPSADTWTYDFIFTVEGSYTYQCNPHVGLGMVGTITVGQPKSYLPVTIGDITTEDGVTGIADSLGKLYEISGTVHGVNISAGDGLLFWIIDDNHDGISIFNLNQTLGYEVNEGDLIKVRGTLGQFRGLTQLNVDEITVDGSGTIQSPIVASNLDEQLESKLVKLENFSFVNMDDWRGNGSSFNIAITNGSDTLTVRIDSNTDLADAVAPSQPFDVTGLVNQFDFNEPFLEFYQLMPRSGEDFMMVSSTEDNSVENISISPNPTSNELNINGLTNIDQVCLYNTSGQLMKIWYNPTNSIILNVDNGIYLLSVTKNRSVTYKKVMVVK